MPAVSISFYMAPISEVVGERPRLAIEAGYRHRLGQEPCELRSAHFTGGHRKLPMASFSETAAMAVDGHVVRRIGDHQVRFGSVQQRIVANAHIIPWAG